jgi:hypothetical protein
VTGIGLLINYQFRYFAISALTENMQGFLQGKPRG